MDLEAKSLLDYILTVPAVVEVVERRGYRYVYPTNGVVRYNRDSEPHCPSRNKPNGPGGLHCERPVGHEGPHLAWYWYDTAPTEDERYQLFVEGYWE